MEADSDWTPNNEEDYAKVNGDNSIIRYKCDKFDCPPYLLDFTEIGTQDNTFKFSRSNLYFLNVNMIYMNMSDTKLVLT